MSNGCLSLYFADDGSTLMRIDHTWAKSLTKLWRFNPYDFEAEKRYNVKLSQRQPYCAVCSVINQIPEVGMGFSSLFITIFI